MPAVRGDAVHVPLCELRMKKKKKKKKKKKCWDDYSVARLGAFLCDGDDECQLVWLRVVIQRGRNGRELIRQRK